MISEEKALAIALSFIFINYKLDTWPDLSNIKVYDKLLLLSVKYPDKIGTIVLKDKTMQPSELFSDMTYQQLFMEFLDLLETIQKY